MADSDAGRGFQTRIIAGMAVPEMVAQVLDLEVSPERELVLCERSSTIALQRQLRQNFAAGRFEGESASRRYEDIGRLMFVPAMTPLRMKYEGRSISIVRCMFPRQIFAGLFAPDDEMTARKLQMCLNIKSATIRSLMIRIAGELEARTPFTEELLLCYGRILIIELKRYFDRRVADGGLSRGGMSAGALRRVIERIEADALPPTVEELVVISGLSKRHLTRAFRQSTGQSILEKINESRFHRAMLRIFEGALPVEDIARMSGYHSSASFSQAYSKWFGECPTRHRKNMSISRV